MSDSGYSIFALMFLLTTLVLALRQVSACLREGSWQVFFWGGSIYFAILPLMMDAYLIISDDLGRLHDAIVGDSPNYWDGVYAVLIFKAAVFVFLFCFIFYYADAFFKAKFPERSIESGFRYNSLSLGILFVLTVLPCALLYVEGADFIYNQKNEVVLSRSTTYLTILLPLGPVVAYSLFGYKKYLIGSIFLLPLMFVAFVGQSRSLFFFVPGMIIMYFLRNAKAQLGLLRLTLFLAVLLLLAQAVKMVGNENYGYWTADNKLAFIAANTFRDGSVGDLYYSFHVREVNEDLTTAGNSSLALAATGVLPPFLGRDLFDAQNTVTYKIYALRFGEYDFGSMHPTIFGYFYFDLGYFGVLAAFVLVLVLRLYGFLMSRYAFSMCISPVMIAGFYFVAMRGSLNVAYFRLVYGGIAIFLILMLVFYVQRILMNSASSTRRVD